MNRVPITSIDELDGTCEFAVGKKPWPCYCWDGSGASFGIPGERTTFLNDELKTLIAAGLITKPAPPVEFECEVLAANRIPGAGYRGELMLMTEGHFWPIAKGDRVKLTKIGSTEPGGE